MVPLKVPFCETLRLTWHNKLGQCHQAIQCNQRVKIGGVHRSICILYQFSPHRIEKTFNFFTKFDYLSPNWHISALLVKTGPPNQFNLHFVEILLFFLPRSNIRTRNTFLKCSQQRNAKTQNLANSCRSLFSKVELSSLKVFITGHKEPHNNK